MGRFIGSLAISGLVGVCFTSAVVLAQAGGGAPKRVDEVARPKKATGAALALPGQKRSPLEIDEGPQDAKAGRAVQGKRALAAAAVQKDGRLQDAIVVKRAVAAPAQANRAPLTQQFTNQARPLLRAELLFARNVCGLDRDELRKVNREAQKMLSEVVGKLVDAQFQPRARMVAQGQVPKNLDSHQLLRDGVSSVMKKNLSAEKWSRYEAEVRKRDLDRKRTTIAYLVDAIDREVFMNPEQCDRIKTALEEHWDPGWTMYLQNHLFGNKYFPMSIDPLVTPVLSQAQQKVWSGVQKVGVYWGFAGNLAGFANDADGLEVELGEPVQPGRGANAGMGVMKMRAVQVFDTNVELRTTVTKAASAAAVKDKAKAAAAEAKRLQEKASRDRDKAVKKAE